MVSELEKEKVFGFLGGFFLKSWATLNLLSVAICGQSGSSSLQLVASHWQTLLC